MLSRCGSGRLLRRRQQLGVGAEGGRGRQGSRRELQEKKARSERKVNS